MGADRFGTREQTIIVGSGTTVSAVFDCLGLDQGVVGVISSAGRLMRPESVISESCTIDVYPVFGGG